MMMKDCRERQQLHFVPLSVVPLFRGNFRGREEKEEEMAASTDGDENSASYQGSNENDERRCSGKWAEQLHSSNSGYVAF